MTVKQFLFQVADLKDYVVRFLTKLEVPEEDAKIVADVLITADLRGINSHGVVRLYTYYGSRLQQKLVNPRSTLRVVNETPTTALLDGGNGLGQVNAYHAMKSCIEKAQAAGVAFVTVRNSNHYGIASYYAMMALEHDMIGISLTNSQPLVAPTYARAAVLGTNPISVAVPAGKERPYVLDMATSIVPIGRVVVYQKSGEQIPLGWGMDKSGKLTTDPAEVIDGGALLPLGGSDIMRGYKGYGLGLLVDILSGVLSGAAFGKDVAHPGEARTANVGHFFAAFRIDAFRPLQEFKADMDALIQQLKNAPKAEGHDRIYIHGEKEFELAERYAKEGIPLLAPVVESLEEVGHQLGVEFDLQRKPLKTD